MAPDRSTPASSSQRVLAGASRSSVSAEVVLSVARGYVIRGYGVFPVHSATKRPWFRRGSHPRWAAGDAGVAGHLAAAWDVTDVEDNWPMALDVGIGLVPPRGVAILDLDEKNRPGIVEIARLTWPEVFGNGEHRTRNAGAHVPVAVPPRCGLRQSVDTTIGIDVRMGLKGYVVAPPSPGYACVLRFRDTDSLIPIPSDLAELLSPPSAPPRTVRGRSRDLPRRLGRYVWAAVEGEHDRVMSAGEGTRNTTLHTAAVRLGTLVGAKVLAEENAFAALMAGALAADVPLPPQEAERTIRSGLAWGQRHPRKLREDRS